MQESKTMKNEANHLVRVLTFRFRPKSTVINLIETCGFSGLSCFMGRLQDWIFSRIPSQGKRCLIETLKGDLQPVVTEKFDMDYGNESELSAKSLFSGT